MILRPRQQLFVERSLAALDKYTNTLGVAPTGAGKSIMLSAVAGQWLQNTGGQACVLAHRDELTAQNESKFLRVNPHVSTSIFDAKEKSWSGDVTFSMVQTLSRESGLRQIPSLDLLVIDEAHHVAADSYRRVIDRVIDVNPDAAIYGVTATPNRADKKGLRPVFSNVADQITLLELIASGHLVKPITYDIDLGQRQALSEITGSASVVDQATNLLLNTRPTNASVVKHWREKAGDRKTIVFCSTVDHAKQVTAAFLDQGVSAGCVHGELSASDRQAVITRYESGDVQVIVNVGVLTEGYDYPPTSCVVLLRLSSQKSMYIQMVGRGLRTVSPQDYPGINKTDCLVLDFGTSTSSYGRLEEPVDLDGSITQGDAPTKNCPECDALIPAASRECSLCGYIFEFSQVNTVTELTDFVMTEVDILNRSFFQWCDLFHDTTALLATGFDAWAGLFFLEGCWYAVAGLKQMRVTLLASGDKRLCLAAADDWLNEHETEKAATKSRSWLKQSATQQQLKFLHPKYRHDFTLTRYHASCLLAFKFNKRDIHSTVFKAAEQSRAA